MNNETDEQNRIRDELLQTKQERERERVQRDEKERNGKCRNLTFSYSFENGAFFEIQTSVDLPLLSRMLNSIDCSIFWVFNSSALSLFHPLSLVPIDHHFNTGIITLMDFNGNSLSIQTINRSI